MSDLIDTISPLAVDKAGIEAALVFAEAGVPACFVTVPTLGTTAPATKAGAFVCFPQDSRCRLLTTGLVHHSGVPSEAATCGTDSPGAGTWQAAVEKGLDLGQGAGEGIDLMPSTGLVNVYTLFVPEDIFLDDGLSQRARYALLDLDLGDDAMARDAIADIGPGGHFQGHKHARRHMCETVAPAITHQPGPSGALRDPVKMAREKAELIWREYRPEPLAADKAAELTKNLAAAEAKLRAQRGGAR